MLDGDIDYERLKKLAKAWAAEWSRTAVKARTRAIVCNELQ